MFCCVTDWLVQIVNPSLCRRIFWRTMRTKLWSRPRCRKSSTTCWSLIQILLKRWDSLTSYINRCVRGGSLLHQLCGFHSLLSITWTTWTAWGSRTSSCRLTASYIISTDSSCLETRGRVTGTRATAGASATLLSTWPACTVALDTSEYKNYLDRFLLYKAQIIQQLSLPSVSRRTWLCRRRSASPRSPTTTCACSTVW